MLFIWVNSLMLVEMMCLLIFAKFCFIVYTKLFCHHDTQPFENGSFGSYLSTHTYTKSVSRQLQLTCMEEWFWSIHNWTCSAVVAVAARESGAGECLRAGAGVSGQSPLETDGQTGGWEKVSSKRVNSFNCCCTKIGVLKKLKTEVLQGEILSDWFEKGKSFHGQVCI